jgi:hypothetical protein
MDNFFGQLFVQYENKIPDNIVINTIKTNLAPSDAKISSVFHGFNISIKKQIKNVDNELSSIQFAVPLYYYRLSKANLNHRGIILYENKIIKESIINLFEYYLKTRKKFYIYLRGFYPKKQLNETIFSVENYLDFNYFHWVVDTLPRIAILLEAISTENNKKINILIGSRVSKFQEETLKLIYGDKINILVYPNKNIIVHDLLVTGWPFKYSAVTRIYNPIYWELMLSKSQLKLCSSYQSNRILLVSRKNSSTRYITNEDDFVEKLGNWGHDISVIQLENLSFSEQITLFRETKVVIAPHGASAANLLFSTASLFIEFMPLNRKKGLKEVLVTAQICRYKDINHHIFGINNNPDSISESMTIPDDFIEEIDKIIKLIYFN